MKRQSLASLGAVNTPRHLLREEKQVTPTLQPTSQPLEQRGSRRATRLRRYWAATTPPQFGIGGSGGAHFEPRDFPYRQRGAMVDQQGDVGGKRA